MIANEHSKQAFFIAVAWLHQLEISIVFHNDNTLFFMDSSDFIKNDD